MDGQPAHGGRTSDDADSDQYQTKWLTQQAIEFPANSSLHGPNNHRPFSFQTNYDGVNYNNKSLAAVVFRGDDCVEKFAHPRFKLFPPLRIANAMLPPNPPKPQLTQSPTASPTLTPTKAPTPSYLLRPGLLGLNNVAIAVVVSVVLLCALLAFGGCRRQQRREVHWHKLLANTERSSNWLPFFRTYTADGGEEECADGLGDALLGNKSCEDSKGSKKEKCGSCHDGSDSGWILDVADLSFIREVGAGASAKVFLGSFYGNQVAIKLFHQPPPSNEGRPMANPWDAELEEGKRRRGEDSTGDGDRNLALTKIQNLFKNEARLLSRLHHPNIAAFYGVSCMPSTGQVLLVTEYCARGSCADMLYHGGYRRDRHSRPSALEEEERKSARTAFFKVVLGISQAMQYCHARSVVHRDLKPDNVLLDDQGQPKLCDFGISRLQQASVPGGMTMQQMTMTGGVGTPVYMAVEMITGGSHPSIPSIQASSRVDVFSMGVLMWTLWTHELPYQSEGRRMTPFAFMAAVVGGMRPPLPSAEGPGGCPEQLRRLMERCWAGEPSDRPSFAEVTRELAAIENSLERGTAGHSARMPTAVIGRIGETGRSSEQQEPVCMGVSVIITSEDDSIERDECHSAPSSPSPLRLSTVIV
jgi:serine/threonine protein kinase